MAIQGPFVGGNTEESILSLAAGGRIVDVLHGKAVLNFGSIAAQDQGALSISVPGARVDDIVAISEPNGIPSGLVVAARIGSNDTVNVRALNITAGAIDPPAGVYRAIVFKFAEGV
jgi:hypothetical protein